MRILTCPALLVTYVRRSFHTITGGQVQGPRCALCRGGEARRLGLRQRIRLTNLKDDGVTDQQRSADLTIKYRNGDTASLKLDVVAARVSVKSADKPTTATRLPQRSRKSVRFLRLPQRQRQGSLGRRGTSRHDALACCGRWARFCRHADMNGRDFRGNGHARSCFLMPIATGVPWQVVEAPIYARLSRSNTDLTSNTQPDS